jgi:hypothetical protein
MNKLKRSVLWYENHSPERYFFETIAFGVFNELFQKSDNQNLQSILKNQMHPAKSRKLDKSTFLGQKKRYENQHNCINFRISYGGRGWIRTTEAISSRFTVCPLWPLGNSPILS